MLARILLTDVRLLSQDLMESFNRKLSVLIDSGAFQDPVNALALCKVLALWAKNWLEMPHDLVTKSLLELKPHISNLPPIHTRVVTKLILKRNCCPVSVFYELDKRCRYFFDNSKEMHAERSAFLKLSLATQVRPISFDEVREVVLEAMDKKESFPYFMADVFYIMRESGIQDPKLSSDFLMKSLEYCMYRPIELLTLSKIYLSFNSHGGHHQDLKFESTVMSQFSLDIDHNPFPWQFISMLRFLLACSPQIKRSTIDKFFSVADTMGKYHRFIHLKLSSEDV